MELQNFITENKENKEYLNEFKKLKLYVRKYSLLNLALIKCYQNNNYDYDTYPWLRYCRGAIINIKTDRLVVIPPPKSIPIESMEGLTTLLNENENEDCMVYQILEEGTMVNMFYHNDEWMISTRSNIGCKNYWKEKITFKEMFEEVSGDVFNSSDLNKDHCYSFVLQHQKNKIVSPIYKNCILLVHEYDLIHQKYVKDSTLTSEFIIHVTDLNYDHLLFYLNHNIDFKIKGFTIKCNDKRYSWLNPNYEYVLNLRMNHNHKLLDYIDLRQKKLLTEYLKYFPEDIYLFNEYKNFIYLIKNKLYNSYVSFIIKKEIELKDVEYSLKPLLFELHDYYKYSNQKITFKIVNDYVFHLPGKKILFIQKYL